jgi:hypothetical protein
MHQPGGRNVPVTLENRDVFVALYSRQLLIGQAETCLSSFRAMFRLVADGVVLKMLDAPDLELLLCGHTEFTFGLSGGVGF